MDTTHTCTYSTACIVERFGKSLSRRKYFTWFIYATELSTKNFNGKNFPIHSMLQHTASKFVKTFFTDYTILHVGGCLTLVTKSGFTVQWGQFLTPGILEVQHQTSVYA